MKPGSNIPPSLEEIRDYLEQIGAKFTAEAFFDHYESNGWMIGKVKMRNWQAGCRTWTHDRPRLSVIQQVKPRSAYEIQTRLEACKKEYQQLINPAGAAYPTAVLEGEKLKRAKELGKAIRQLEMELCRA